MSGMARWALRSAKRQLRAHLEPGEVLLEFDIGEQEDSKFHAPVIAVCSDRALYLLWGPQREVQPLPLAGITAIAQPTSSTIVIGVRDAPDIWMSFGRSPRPLFPVLRERLLRLHVFETSTTLAGFKSKATFRPWRPGTQGWWRLEPLEDRVGPAPSTPEALASLMSLMRDASRVAARDDPLAQPGVTELVPAELDDDQMNVAWAHRFRADSPIDVVLGDLVSESGRGRVAKLMRTQDSLHLVVTQFSGLDAIVSMELARILDVEALPINPQDPGRMVRIYYGPEHLGRFSSAADAARSGDWTFTRIAVPSTAEGQGFILRLGDAVDRVSPFGAVVGTVVGR